MKHWMYNVYSLYILTAILIAVFLLFNSYLSLVYSSLSVHILYTKNELCVILNNDYPETLTIKGQKNMPQLGIEPRTQGFSVPCSTN